MTENYFGPPNSGKFKSQNSSFNCFSLRAGDKLTWVLLDQTVEKEFETSTLLNFDTSTTLTLQCFSASTLRGLGTSSLRHFETSGLRDFDASAISHTSHFETPEDYFPEHLDQLPPASLKINKLCSLPALCSGAILHTTFNILNAYTANLNSTWNSHR
jgi:hypothetical protein